MIHAEVSPVKRQGSFYVEAVFGGGGVLTGNRARALSLLDSRLEVSILRGRVDRA